MFRIRGSTKYFGKVYTCLCVFYIRVSQCLLLLILDKRQERVQNSACHNFFDEKTDNNKKAFPLKLQKGLYSNDFN